jgi:hypothetical protein
MEEIVIAWELLFNSVNVWLALVEPTWTLPKSLLVGVRVTDGVEPKRYSCVEAVTVPLVSVTVSVLLDDPATVGR